MKTVAALTAAVLLLLLGAAYIVIPPPYPGLFDADLNRLAETNRAGYCAGVTYMQTRGKGDPEATANCRHTDTRNNTIDHTAVIPGFCAGAIQTGAAVPHTECVAIFETRRWWPTRDGQISEAFNENYPYPGDLFQTKKTDDGSASRTGDREGNIR